MQIALNYNNKNKKRKKKKSLKVFIQSSTKPGILKSIIVYFSPGIHTKYMFSIKSYKH